MSEIFRNERAQEPPEVESIWIDQLTGKAHKVEAVCCEFSHSVTTKCLGKEHRFKTDLFLDQFRPLEI